VKYGHEVYKRYSWTDIKTKTQMNLVITIPLFKAKFSPYFDPFVS